MDFVRLGHVAEDTGGGERENSIKFCAFLRTVVAKIHGVRSSWAGFRIRIRIRIRIRMDPH
jgi:hypothetical protein